MEERLQWSCWQAEGGVRRMQREWVRVWVLGGVEGDWQRAEAVVVVQL